MAPTTFRPFGFISLKIYRKVQFNALITIISIIYLHQYHFKKSWIVLMAIFALLVYLKFPLRQRTLHIDTLYRKVLT